MKDPLDSWFPTLGTQKATLSNFNDTLTEDKRKTGIMFIRQCPISRIFSTALEVKQLEDGRLVGNELECAMVRRMGGLEKSEAQNSSLESQREPSLVWLVFFCFFCF